MAPKLLPKRKRRTKAATLYNNESVVDAREQLQMATEQSEVQKLKSQLSDSYKTAESNYYKERFDEVTDNFNQNNPSAACNTPEERQKQWKDNFEALLGEEPSILDDSESIETISDCDLEISTESFTMEELNAVLKASKAGKAPGRDEIPLEFWQIGEFKVILLSLCNFILNSTQIPLEFARSGIVPLPKKGNLNLATNYRGKPNPYCSQNIQ